MRLCSALLLSFGVFAQQPALQVDFPRDVQPIFQTRCIGCHGPSVQMNGFRLDRRSAAMRGGTIAVIGPGNSEGSRLYLKLVSDHYGPRMPPDGALSAEQIAIIKTWIDQGAQWPDALAGETPAPPSDPRGERIIHALRSGNQSLVRELLRSDPAVVKLRGPGGSTPLQYAALYSDARTLRLFLDKGADVNARNLAGATALMWAVDDLEKTRLLLDRGADPNARSDVRRTPLMMASGRAGNLPVVNLLLENGAKVGPTAPALGGETNALKEAALAGDEAILRTLIQHGASPNSVGPDGLTFSIRAQCAPCLQLLLAQAGPDILNAAMFLASPPFAGDGRAIKLLLDHGADARAKGPAGVSILISAVASDSLDLDSIQALLAGGADPNARVDQGPSALDVARQRGQTPVVDLLRKAGARDSDPLSLSLPEPRPAASARDAVARSLPLLQRSDESFLRKTGCVGCHHNTLTSIAIATARRNGYAVDEDESRRQMQTIGAYLESWRERVLQAYGIPGDSDTLAPILAALAEANYPADAATDAMARFIKGQQRPDGHWEIFAHRPPLEVSSFAVTANALRSLQAFAPKPSREQYGSSVRLAAQWLRNNLPASTEDRAYRIFGLRWSGAPQKVLRDAGSELANTQHADGGWSQRSTLDSDAYSTGEALVALRESGMRVDNPSYQRGVAYLLRSQFEDGAWHVSTRALPLQPYFESGFPFGRDQFISAAATNWAVMALAPVRLSTTTGL